MIGPQIIIPDIECSHALYAAFPSNKEQRLRSENMIRAPYVISGAWKWYGAKKINSVSVLDDPDRFKACFYDDYHVIKTLSDAIGEADMIVGHNFESFDWKYIKARMIYHRIKPIDDRKTFDTLKMARKVRFPHNDMRFLAKHLGVEEKGQTPSGSWLGALMGDEQSIKNIVKYNKLDIPPSEGLYDRLKPYFQSPFNHNMSRGDGVECCQACGHTVLHKNGFRYNRTGKYQRYTCNDCGAITVASKSLKRVNMR